VSADTPDQVELFQGVARRVSDMLQRPVASYANGREIVVTFGQQEAPALVLRSPGWAFPVRLLPRSQPAIRMARTIILAIAVLTVDHPPSEKRDAGMVR
jgi:hypothetical protein